MPSLTTSHEEAGRNPHAPTGLRRRGAVYFVPAPRRWLGIACVAALGVQPRTNATKDKGVVNQTTRVCAAPGERTMTEEPVSSRPPPSHGKLVTVLLGASALAGLALVPYSLALTSGGTGDQGLTRRALTCGVVLQALILYGCIEAGLRWGPRIGLRTPLLSYLLGGEPMGRSELARLLAMALLGGAVASVLIAGLAYLLQPLLPPPPATSPHWSPIAGLLASFGAGVTEELMFRFGIMTLFAWLAARLFTREGSPAPFIWLANVLAALLFGAAHLPLASTLSELTAAVVLMVVALNALLGLFCGWLYWRYGIVSAMLAHFSADVVVKVLVPALSF